MVISRYQVPILLCLVLDGGITVEVRRPDETRQVRGLGHAVDGGPSPIIAGLASPSLHGSRHVVVFPVSSVGSIRLMAGARGSGGPRTTPITLVASGRHVAMASGGERVASRMASRR